MKRFTQQLINPRATKSLWIPPSWRAACVVVIVNFLSFQASANIINGDFETGDLTGWQTDNGVSANEGVSVINGTLSQVAQIKAQAEDGANGFTLFQNIDSYVASGSQFSLLFDWVFAGVDTGESFSVSLFDGTDYFAADGSYGDLFYTETHGSGPVNLEIDFANFSSLSNWSLEFQLNTGFDFVDDSALLQIDNVQFISNVSVPEPFSFGFLLLTACVMAIKRRQKVR
jgi:hypothetical protein